VQRLRQHLREDGDGLRDLGRRHGDRRREADRVGADGVGHEAAAQRGGDDGLGVAAVAQDGGEAATAAASSAPRAAATAGASISTIVRIVARAAAVAIAVPENVLPWSPGRNTAATSLRAQSAPIGMPLPIPLAE